MDGVEWLIEQLKSEDAYLRRNAVELLGVIKDKRVLPTSIEALEHEDKHVRREATSALGRIKDASAVPVLVRALKDGDGDVRNAAAWVLEKIGEPALPHLVDTVKEGGYDTHMMRLIINILGKIGNPALPTLTNLSKNEDKIMRGDVIRALEDMGDPSAVPVLIEILIDNDYAVRTTAARAIKRIIEKCKTTEDLEEIEKGIERGSEALRKGRPDKTLLINAQIEIAKLTQKIAEKKDELAPKKDLLLDDKPKPPKKGGGVYRTVGRKINLR